ncbi:MAG TPA: hypothetical protein VMQ99_09180 [Acetobacteraceae bacterium]|nr:hypothetical protein [Acetobacteraceae bacterium]
MLWCLGMYASGSTWAFNAAMKVAAIVVPRTPAVGRFVTAMTNWNSWTIPCGCPSSSRTTPTRLRQPVGVSG